MVKQWDSLNIKGGNCEYIYDGPFKKKNHDYL